MGAPTSNQALPNGSLMQPSENATTAADDTEWEYEYDEHETEDYYFTLDVSTHHKGPISRRDAQEPTQSRRKTDTGSNDTASRPNAASLAATSNNKNVMEVNGTSAVEDDDSGGRLQFLDLHSNNPLIMLDKQLYSCHWSTGLGTQMYVTRPGVANEPLRPGRVLDVVGMSRAKLVGRPAIARARRHRSRSEVGGSVENAIAIDEGDSSREDGNEVDDSEVPAATEQPSTKHVEAKDPEVKARESFFQRLRAIKQKKGELDTVPLNGIANYEVPSNKDEIRARALAADAALEKSNDIALAGKNRKRGSYQKKQTLTTETGTPGPEQKRRKPGPASGSAVRDSLGLPG